MLLQLFNFNIPLCSLSPGQYFISSWRLQRAKQYKFCSIKHILTTINLSKAENTGRSSYKDVIIKSDVRIKCNAKVFNGFCNYKVFPQQRQTDVREFAEPLANSIWHELRLIWVQKKTIIEAPIKWSFFFPLCVVNNLL